MLNTGKLAGKVLYITGASRGIGLEIAKTAAKDGAKVVVAAKTAEPHPKLPGTIYTAAKEIEALGGQALPVVVDVRFEDAIQESVETAVKQFGGIDIVVNNASAISLTGTQETPMKTYDLMHQINTRGTYLVSKCCLPYLKESASKGRNPHILNNSPPLSLKPIWFKNHVAYTMAKYGMSMCVLGMAEEFRDVGIGVNAIWPKTAIMSAAMEMLGGGGDISNNCRTPQIMADAAYVILTRDAKNFTGNFCVDEAILRENGMTDFSSYLAKGAKEELLMPDFFLDEYLEHLGVKGDSSDLEKESIVSMSKTVSQASSGDGDSIEAVFKKIESMLDDDIIKKTKAVYTFNVSDQNSDWYLDLKNGSGAWGKGSCPEKSDAHFTMNSKNFDKMFTGKLKPTTAFMSGRLKISGNMASALKLEKLMGKMQTRSYSTEGNGDQISEVFGKIEGLLSDDLVKSTQAVYTFSVSDQKSDWYLDLKNGTGACGQGMGDVESDAHFTMTSANFSKMFAGELKPAAAFMSGKLKIKGNMGKAMKLEKLMGKLQTRSYSTLARRSCDLLNLSSCRAFSGDLPNYTEIEPVFVRIKSIANPAVIKKINAVFVFNIEEEGTWHVDFKKEGTVGKGIPENEKPDVIVGLTKETFLKIFNRELKPATAFMDGKIKLSGDLSRALVLESVMKATR